MKQISYLLNFILFILISCQPVENQEAVAVTPNMEFGGWSGTADDHSKEALLTRELMEKYIANKFDDVAYMMSEDGNFFFNTDQVTKAEWLGAASGHHSLFANISNNKIQPANVTSATFENGSVWSMAWFVWTGTGKITGTEVRINVHHAFRFEDEKIVDAYHFFDPTLLNNEILASSK